MLFLYKPVDPLDKLYIIRYNIVRRDSMNDVWLKELAEEQTKRLLEYYIKLRQQHK